MTDFCLTKPVERHHFDISGCNISETIQKPVSYTCFIMFLKEEQGGSCSFFFFCGHAFLSFHYCDFRFFLNVCNTDYDYIQNEQQSEPPPVR